MTTPSLKALRLFVKGHSPQKVAALLHPGIGARALVPVQQEVWAEMRKAVLWLVREYDRLRHENRTLTRRCDRLEAEVQRLRAALRRSGKGTT